MSVLHRWALLGILIVAAGLRFVGLSDQSMWLDEVWALETVAGHASQHLDLPVGRLIDAPPDVTGMAAAGPAWRVWTGLDRVTHPPGSYLLLRAWAELFGTSDGATRSLSAVCSTAAVAAMFWAVRPWAGTGPALWATAVMAVAGPQVHAAHEARPYALLTVWAVVTLGWVGRIVRLGASGRRTVGLTLLVLAGLYLHYFVIGAVAAVGGYGLVATRGATRRAIVTAVVVAGAVFVVTWGHWMLRQVPAFSPADPRAAFLREAGPGHLRLTAWRLLTLPASMLVDARPIPWAYGVVGAVVYGMVGARVVRRRHPGRRGTSDAGLAGLWALWYAGVVGVLLVLDVGRSTAHLKFLRYAMVAAPAVYAGVATTAGRGWAVAAAVAFAGWSLPGVYAPSNDDFRGLALTLQRSVRPGDVVVFAGPAETASPQVRYLMTSYYVRPPGPVVLLDRPADAALMAELRDRPALWLVADPETPSATRWLPGYHRTLAQGWPVVGSLVRMERDGGKPEIGHLKSESRSDDQSPK